MSQTKPKSAFRLLSGRRAAAPVFSFLFAAAFVLNRRVVFGGDIQAKPAENYLRPGFDPADGLLFLGIAAAGWALLLFLSGLLERKKEPLAAPERGEEGRFMRTSCGILLLFWLPYLLSLAPGNLFEDSLDSIGQMLSHGHPVSNHHPMFYTLAIGVFLKAGQLLFHSLNGGVFLFTLCQAALMIACVTGELVFLFRRGAPRWALYLSLAFFACMPIYPAYAVTMWKDVPYSCALLLLSLLLSDLSRDRMPPGWRAALFLLFLSAMMTRNNGLYTALFAGILGAPLCRRARRGILAALLSSVLLFSCVSALAVRLWNITGDFAESVGIPLQQLGYTINDGGSFSQADREYLFRLCPEEVWNYAYRPMLDDPLKWNPRFDLQFLYETKTQFLGVWLRGLIQNPLRYLRGYLLATYGFWSPTAAHEWGYMSIKLPANAYGITWMNPLGEARTAGLRAFIASHIPQIGSGALLWLLLFALALCHLLGRPAAAYLPALGNELTILIATPAAFSLRYVYILALGLPLFLLLPLTQAERPAG